MRLRNEMGEEIEMEKEENENKMMIKSLTTTHKSKGEKENQIKKIYDQIIIC